MPTTLGDIKSEVRLLIGEMEGTALYENPFVLDTLIWRQADRLCQDSDCLYAALDSDVTAGEASHCAPDGLYKVKGTQFLNNAGNWYPLKPEDPAAMDRFQGRMWRNWEASDPPRFAVFTGTTALELAPPPLVSRAAALRWEGFYKPGAVWEYDGDGTALPLTDASVCPLPSWAIGALVYRVAALRASLAVQDPQIQALTPVLRTEAEILSGAVERHAATLYERGRLGLYTSRRL